MIDTFLAGADWAEPPAIMSFESSFGSLLDEVGLLVAELRAVERGAAGSSAHCRRAEEDGLAAAKLYLRVPALINVILNYKICTEHGLPLHPTVYYELKEARRYRMEHPIEAIESANRLFRESIELSRAAYRLDPAWEESAEAFRSRLPKEVPAFIYTGGGDKYTWRASEPARIKAMAGKVESGFRPELIVAAAHGSIIPALLLAEYLSIPLYFIRFSMFKRSDEEPIVSIADEAWLAAWRDARVLVFDEDVAKGTTLELFSRRMARLFITTRSTCVIRHAGSSIKPDYYASVWWD